MMKSKLDLKTVVQRVYGNSLKEIISPVNSWQMFKSYVTPDGDKILLKLIEVPSHLRTSEEYILKIKQEFRNILHDVDFILVERNFEADVYLLKAEQNLISVESHIRIKCEAGQKFEERIIENFLQFARVLESHRLSSQISFGLDEMAITEDGHFLLANYSLYFKSESEEKNNLSRDVKNLLVRLLMPSENAINLSHLYCHVEENYSAEIQMMVEKCMAEPDFKASEVVTAMTQPQENLLETTITDSFHSGTAMNEQIHNVTHSESDLSLPLLVSDSKPTKSKYRISIFAIVFVIILIVIGAITFQYLKPRPLMCSDSQYLDKDLNKCLGCDPSCETCESQTNQACLSCKDALFLVKKDRTQKVGKCSLSCSGTKVKPNVCIDSI